MFVVKLVGIVLTVISCALIGFFKSYILSSRIKKLSLFLDGVNMLYENIEQEGESLNEAIKNSFFKCEFLRLEHGSYLCYDDALKQDKTIIDDFFKDLGHATKKIECDRINNFKLKLKSHITDAERENSQKGKIYKVLGICLGLSVAILLI